MTDVRHIRAATIDDADALADVYISSARHHAALDPEFYTVTDREAFVEHLQQQLAEDSDANVVRFVAEVDGMMVGSADVALRSPSSVSIRRIGRERRRPPLLRAAPWLSPPGRVVDQGLQAGDGDPPADEQGRGLR